jgi:flagellar biosynthesis protein FliQ
VATAPIDTINNIIIFVDCIAALSHFISTYEGIHKGTLGFVPKLGRWMMLMAFGAPFGNTVMTRFGMYPGRILFTLRD